MAKEFYTEGVNGSQVLHESPTEQIPVYDDDADAEADLANLEVGQIVATKTEYGYEVTDEVEKDSTDVVTSGGVAKAVYFNPNGTAVNIISAGTAVSSNGTSYTPTKNGYVIVSLRMGTGSTVTITINNITVWEQYTADTTTATTYSASPIANFAVPLRKGQTIKITLTYGSYAWSNKVAFYPEE